MGIKTIEENVIFWVVVGFGGLVLTAVVLGFAYLIGFPLCSIFPISELKTCEIGGIIK